MVMGLNLGEPDLTNLAGWAAKGLRNKSNGP